MMQTPNTQRPDGSIGLTARLCAAWVLVLCSCCSVCLYGQSAVDSEVIPVDSTLDADARISADKASGWSEGDTRFLLLEGHVHFSMGTYGFKADHAVVRIIARSQHDQTVRYLAVYLDEAEPLSGRSTVGVTSQGLLVTGSTRGGVQLVTDLLRRQDSRPDTLLVDEAVRRFTLYDNRLTDRTQQASTAAKLSGSQGLPPREEGGATERVRITQYSETRESVDTVEKSKAFNVTSPPPQRRRNDQTDSAARPDSPPDVEQQAATADKTLTQPDQHSGAPAADNTAEEETLIEDTGIIPTMGVMNFSFDRIVIEEIGNEIMVMLIGDVRLFFRTNRPDVQFRQMTLKAEKAVLFIDRRVMDQLTGAEVEADAVRGVYLEDNVVATDGQYTIRAPRVYYDLKLDKAILLDAVLFTYDLRRHVPLYARAEVIRQTAAESFAAEEAILTTSEFAEPHFSIRANKITVKRIKRPDQPGTQQFTATHTTLNWYDLPVFYWPYIAAEGRDLPLRSVSAGYSRKVGPEVKTSWDLFSLTGRSRPEGVDLIGRIDYRGEHGPAVGADMSYHLADMYGNFNSYLLPSDSGTDDLAGRRDIEHDDDVRGYLHLQHRQHIINDWQLSLEASYVSDFTFLDEFYTTEAVETKTYESSIYMKKQEDQWALTLLAKYDLTDFTPQLTTLQTPGYTVEKLPELGMHTIGWSLPLPFGVDDALTWFSETRISRVRAHFGEENPADRGFKQRDSRELFGFDSTTGFEQAANAAGFPLDWITRFDTRHELTLPLKADAVDITPYVSGRITAYDDDFQQFNNDHDDQLRLWGSAGTRLHTQFHRTYDDVQDELFDVHRLRHLIEPNVDLFLMGTTFDAEDLPVYDPDIESITHGTGGRFGVTQTLQTQRGGPGRWRSVDWLQLTTDAVLWLNNPNEEMELARFYGYRPEYSLGTNHFYSRLIWQLSDSLGVNGDVTYSFEHDKVAQWRLGCNLFHGSDLRAFIDYSEIDALDSRLLTYGFTYQLTRKYTTGFTHRLDFSDQQSRRINLWLERKLPRWRMRLSTSYDELDDEAFIGFVLIPDGLDSDFRTLTFR